MILQNSPKQPPRTASKSRSISRSNAPLIIPGSRSTQNGSSGCRRQHQSCRKPAQKIRRHCQVAFLRSCVSVALVRIRDIVLFWIAHGVKIFRVDNPHTKPFPFWEWLIAEMQSHDPDVIFLAEAFTRPKIMEHLAKIGFTQSYSYFTWRNTKRELIEYLQDWRTAPPAITCVPISSPILLTSTLTICKPVAAQRFTSASSLQHPWARITEFTAVSNLRGSRAARQGGIRKQ